VRDEETPKESKADANVSDAVVVAPSVVEVPAGDAFVKVGRPTLCHALLYLTRQVRSFRVSVDVGDSMQPTLAPNDTVLVDVAAYVHGERSLLCFPVGCALRMSVFCIESAISMAMKNMFIFNNNNNNNKGEESEKEALMKRHITVLPQVGDIVICRHPDIKSSYIVKRVGALSADGRTLSLYGDNQGWGQSNKGNGLFGDVDVRLVIGKVVAKAAR